MIIRSVSLPELGLIEGTRAALGAGLALLLADRLGPEQRKAVGWTLVAVGVLTTIPLLAEVLSHKSEDSAQDEHEDITAVRGKHIRRRVPEKWGGPQP